MEKQSVTDWMADYVAEAKLKKYPSKLIANWDETMCSLTKGKKVLCVTQCNKKVMKMAMKLLNEHITLSTYIWVDGTYCPP